MILCLPFAANSGQYSATGLVVLEQFAIGEHVDDRRGQALAGGEDVEQSPLIDPSAGRGVGEARARNHHRLAVQVHGDLQPSFLVQFDKVVDRLLDLLLCAHHDYLR